MFKTHAQLRLEFLQPRTSFQEIQRTDSVVDAADATLGCQACSGSVLMLCTWVPNQCSNERIHTTKNYAANPPSTLITGVGYLRNLPGSTLTFLKHEVREVRRINTSGLLYWGQSDPNTSDRRQLSGNDTHTAECWRPQQISADMTFLKPVPNMCFSPTSDVMMLTACFLSFTQTTSTGLEQH